MVLFRQFNGDVFCCLSAGIVRIPCHNLFVSFSVRVPLQVLPGAEPHRIPFGIGDVPNPVPRRHQADGADHVTHINSQGVQMDPPSSHERMDCFVTPSLSMPSLLCCSEDESSNEV